MLAHLAAVCLMALPAPVGGASKSTRETPSVRDMITAASEVTGLSEDRVDALAFGTVESWIRLRKDALKPLRPYYKWAGTSQSWRMMAIINRRSGRLRVDINDAVAYRTADTGARWRAEVLESARVRGVLVRYAWRLDRKDYKQLAEWIIDEAHADFGPDAAVRVCMERAAIPGPGEPEPEARCTWEISR